MSNFIEARTSYLPEEIIWGHHFKNCIHYDKKEVGIKDQEESFLISKVVQFIPLLCALFTPIT